MINQFKYMSERMSNAPQTIRGIKSRLREEEIEAGAFYMTLPSSATATAWCAGLWRETDSPYI